MQTFLPYKSFQKTAECLDYRRLGKQRVEAMQILKGLNDPNYSWANHPACKMWKGHKNALKLYMNTMIKEWIKRGYNNTMEIVPITGKISYPSWLGKRKFHLAHKSNLLKKDKKYYSKFKWNAPKDLTYIWGNE